MQKDVANKLVCAVQLAELRAEQNKLNQEKVDLENQLEAEQVCQTATLMGQTAPLQHPAADSRCCLQSGHLPCIRQPA